MTDNSGNRFEYTNITLNRIIKTSIIQIINFIEKRASQH